MGIVLSVMVYFLENFELIVVFMGKGSEEMLGRIVYQQMGITPDYFVVLSLKASICYFQYVQNGVKIKSKF